MAYANGLRIKILNVEEVLWTVNMYDTKSGEAPNTTFTDLESPEGAVHIFVVDNDEDKLSPIKAKQAEVKFLSTAGVNLTSFIPSEDDRWYVEIIKGVDEMKFKGFLIPLRFI